MGRTWSKLRRRALCDKEYVVIVSPTDWCLQFKASQSYGMCVGIDISSHDSGQDDIAAKSAALVKEAIADNIIPQDQIHEYSLEKEPNQCTKHALRDIIKANASEVKEEGIFVFHFSGHAFLHENKCVLAAANYHHASTGITANELMEWIRSAECKARHILIVLDCHCAKCIGEKLFSQIQESLNTKAGSGEVHVMFSCSTTSALPPVKILSGSIFSYFLSSALKQQSSENGFNIKDSMDKVGDLCHSFSTLVLNYTQRDGLTQVKIQPCIDSTLNYKLYKPDSDEPDSCQNLKVLYDLCDNSRLPELHPKALNWLKSTEVQKSLKILHSNESLPMPLLYGVFSALLYSISCLHLKYDRTHISKQNLFVVAAIIVVLILEESGHPTIIITRDQVKKGLEYYYKPLKSNGISVKPIEELILNFV